jgi:hypothetical protein
VYDQDHSYGNARSNADNEVDAKMLITLLENDASTRNDSGATPKLWDRETGRIRVPLAVAWASASVVTSDHAFLNTG